MTTNVSILGARLTALRRQTVCAYIQHFSHVLHTEVGGLIPLYVAMETVTDLLLDRRR